MSTNRPTFASASGLLAPETVQLNRLGGREALGQPYEYELELEVDEDGGLSSDAIDDLLRQPCVVRFGSDHQFEVHGILRGMQMQSTAQPQPIVYRAWLVPRMWQLGQAYRSRIFQDLDAPGIIRAVFEEMELAEGQQFELRLSSAYPVSEYTVQYEETDLDFVHRILEHHGIFYFFEQDPDGERVVFADANRACTRLEGFETLPYTPGEAAALAGIYELTREITPQPSTIVLRDYNWRAPSVQLQSQAVTDTRTGRGFVSAYGEHFKTPSEGDALARVRAEERMAGRDVYRGRSGVAGLRPGHRVGLTAHPVGDLDQDYLITSVEHDVDGRALGDAGVGHDLRFAAIPFEVPYRPARRTAKPRIAGVMHARVDGEVPGTAAPIDEYGRYKILFPFDLVGRPGGKASRWVRLAQPASGAGYGIHFPLHIGVEVAVAHLDGDPDRPIIMSSPPNAETITPVTSANPTQSEIRTKTGIVMTWDDDC